MYRFTPIQSGGRLALKLEPSLLLLIDVISEYELLAKVNHELALSTFANALKATGEK